MIHNLTPYPAYKDSGVPWLGEVPAHWEIRRTKTVLKERSQKGFPDEPLLAATQTKGVVRKEQYENRTVLALKDLHLLKRVLVGDFVISLRSFQGGIEYASEQGIISPAYTVLYPIDQRLREYLALLFKSKPYIENLSLFVTGIREGQNIDYERLSRSEIPLPPINEQSAIVRYLDYMDQRIRRYIHAKQKLIKLLEEQKQAIIHRAVTRGLDPDVRLKDSGVEWLGDVPKVCEIKKLKRLLTMIGSGITPKGGAEVYLKMGIPLIRSQNVHFEGLKLDDVAYISDETHLSMNRSSVEPNDVLINITGASIGRCTTIPENLGKANVNQHVCILRPNSQICSDYLQLFLSSYIGQLQVWASQNGAAREGLNYKQLGDFWILLPPVKNQKELVEEIHLRIELILHSINLMKQEIALLREYRTRMISDVVTGKLDVREAAANLSMETEIFEEEIEVEESGENRLEENIEEIIGEEETI